MTKLAGKWVADNAIDSAQIATDAVKAPEIATGAVDTDEIAADAVGQSEIDQTLDLTLTGTIDVTGGTLKAGTPGGDSEVAPKSYVDSVASGLKWKEPVRVRAPGNIDISSAPKKIDDTGMLAGDRVLLDQQSTATEDGIYIWNSLGAAMTRAADAQVGDSFGGVAVLVEEGSTYSDEPFVCVNDTALGDDIIGSYGLSFSSFTGTALPHLIGGDKHTASLLSELNSKISDATLLKDQHVSFQWMEKINSGHVTQGYFNLSGANPVSASQVELTVVGGVKQVNKQCVGATGATPDFDVLNGNECHINNNGAATGLSGDIVLDDIVIVTYPRTAV